MKKKLVLLELFFVGIVTLFIVLLFANLIYRPAVVKGNSMYPTLKNNERVLTSVLDRVLNEPQRFDIVVVKIKNNDQWVKRVIGRPHETIEVKNNVLYINEQIVEQPFLDKNVVTKDFPKIHLKENEYFLMGDNREHSTDSRSLNVPITGNEIISRHVYVYFPFNQIRRAK